MTSSSGSRDELARGARREPEDDELARGARREPEDDELARGGRREPEDDELARGGRREPEDDELFPEEGRLRAMRSVWLSMRDEEPSAGGLAELLAAARGQAAAMQPRPTWWQRVAVALRRPPVLAFATVLVLLCGALVVGRRVDRGGAMPPSSSRMRAEATRSASLPAPSESQTATAQPVAPGNVIDEDRKQEGGLPLSPPPPPPAPSPAPVSAGVPANQPAPARQPVPARIQGRLANDVEAPRQADAPVEQADATTGSAPSGNAAGSERNVSGVGAGGERNVSGVGASRERNVSGAGRERNVSGVGAGPERNVSGVGAAGSERNVSGVGAGRERNVSGAGAERDASGKGPGSQRDVSGAGSGSEHNEAAPGSQEQGGTTPAALYRQCESAASRGDCAAVRRLVERISTTDRGYRARLVQRSPIAKCLSE